MFSISTNYSKPEDVVLEWNIKNPIPLGKDEDGNVYAYKYEVEITPYAIDNETEKITLKGEVVSR